MYVYAEPGSTFHPTPSDETIDWIACIAAKRNAKREVSCDSSLAKSRVERQRYVSRHASQLRHADISRGPPKITSCASVDCTTRRSSASGTKAYSFVSQVTVGA